MSAQVRAVPERLWLVNRVAQQTYPMRFLRSLRMRRDVELCGDNYRVTLADEGGVVRTLGLPVSDAALVSRVYLEGLDRAKAPSGVARFEVDGSLVLRRPIAQLLGPRGRRPRRSRAGCGCLFGASTLSDGKNECGIFLSNGTVLQFEFTALELRGDPVRFRACADLAVYTSRA